MVNNQSQRDATFRALADPTRRQMIERLAHGTMSVNELAEPFDMSAPAISKHLRILEQAEIIDRSIQGRRHELSLNAKGLVAAANWFDEQRAFWEGSFDKLEQLLGKNDRK